VVTRTCPNCGGVRSRVFHHVAAVPVNSCLLFADHQQAKNLESGDIDLAFCPDCSFIYNAAWKPELTVYSDLYEETQGFSPTFKAFHRQLAEQLIGRYDIVGKEIVEIGCGKGEFLSLLHPRTKRWRLGKRNLQGGILLRNHGPVRSRSRLLQDDAGAHLRDAALRSSSSPHRLA
jgi:hypothetical protein